MLATATIATCNRLCGERMSGYSEMSLVYKPDQNSCRTLCLQNGRVPASGTLRVAIATPSSAIRVKCRADAPVGMPQSLADSLNGRGPQFGHLGLLRLAWSRPVTRVQSRHRSRSAASSVAILAARIGRSGGCRDAGGCRNSRLDVRTV